MKNERENEIAVSIAANIKKVRSSKGYNQKEIAELLGISKPTYSQIESGTSTLTISRVLLLCEVLQVNLNELLDHPSAPKSTEEVEELRKAYNRANEKIIDLQNKLLKSEQARNYRRSDPPPFKM